MLKSIIQYVKCKLVSILGMHILQKHKIDLTQEHHCSMVNQNKKNLDSTEQHYCSTVLYKQNIDLNQELCLMVPYPVPDLNQELCSTVAYLVPDLNQELCSIDVSIPDLNQTKECWYLITFLNNIYSIQCYLIRFISYTLVLLHSLLSTPGTLIIIMLMLISFTWAESLPQMSMSIHNAHSLTIYQDTNQINGTFDISVRYTGLHFYATTCTGTMILNDAVLHDHYRKPLNDKPEPKTFDYVFMILGPLNTQIYPNVIEIAMYAHQNTMQKHDFKMSVKFIEHWKLMPFSDLLSRQFLGNLKSKLSKPSPHCMFHNPLCTIIGGGKIAHPSHKDRKPEKLARGSRIFEGSFLSQFPCFALKDKELWPIINVNDISTQSYEFQCIVPKDIALQRQSQLDLICCISVRKILPRLTKDALLSILPYVSNDNYYDTLTRASILTNLEQVLSNKPIDELYSVFKLRKGKTCFPKRQDHLRVIQETTYVPAVQRNTHETNMNPNSGDQLNINDPFPPPPITEETQHRIISNYCKDMDTANFHESGCAVCGALTLIHLSVSTKELSFEYLKEFAESITRKERKDVTDPVQPVDGPVIDQKCKIVCQDCAESVRRRKLPKKALANGLWLGEVPKELSDLTFAEQLLIARVRINRFAVKVESGMHKTKCNIIAFQNPVPQIYDTLPPPTSDIEETFAVMFIRSKPPAEKDFDEVPVYNVRRTKVQEALEWLKLNHVDYENVFISHENLKNYPLNGCPVPVILLKPEYVLTNKQPESTSVNDTEQEEGVTDGPFVAIMHSLTDTGAPVKTWTKLAGDALSHLKNGEKLLILGHTDAAESLFKNPTLYSSAFPWLFPYGLGSIDNDKRKIKISAKLHKGHLLMYHDKRFQMDRLFSLFAFNHEQIKDSTTAGFILTKQSCFQDVCNRISNLDHKVLQDITERYGKEEAVKAETAEEKNCFRLLNDLDKVAEKVDGSFTSKKHMRNELWSLVSYKGAPSWFITFAPADNFHPLCLYYADTEEQFIPRFRTSSDRYRLIAQNPVAGAHFFHTMVQLFLKHVLGVDTEQAGVFGKPSAYYGDS